MAAYCLDTSGFSNPLENLPEDIFASLWAQVMKVVEAGKLCCNTEILTELGSIEGKLGECLKSCAESMCYEIGDDKWPWSEYLDCVEKLKAKYEPVISEYNGNRKGTVGLNDISIIALAMTLKLPIISMEKPNTYQPSVKKMRIPDVCKIEGVNHLSFNEFLRAEGISI
ncbi:DUF4411 family protein [Mesorhizobium sp. M1050]|uniref:DUF4411 family protein n=1 Tax=Mesorhizobium sp. M1050 TaxID=2957051 RepID=UPI00333BA17A